MNPMKKSAFAFITVVVGLLSTRSAQATEFQYHPGPECHLKKYVDKKWVPASDDEVTGKDIVPQSEKNNPSFSNFRIGGSWYNVASSCLQFASPETSADNTNSPNSSPEHDLGALKSTNIRINPLGLLLGVIGADVDFGVGERFTIGPSIAYLKASTTDIYSDGVDYTAWSIGIRANFYLSGPRFHSGWYLAPSAAYIPVTVNDSFSGDSYTATSGAFAISVLAGYQWVFRSGFNMTLGAGAAYYTTKKNVTVTDSSGNSQNVSTPSFAGVLPDLEFGLGWAF